MVNDLDGSFSKNSSIQRREFESDYDSLPADDDEYFEKMLALKRKSLKHELDEI